MIHVVPNNTQCFISISVYNVTNLDQLRCVFHLVNVTNSTMFNCITLLRTLITIIWDFCVHYSGTDHCPVMVYTKFARHRPSDYCENESRLILHRWKRLQTTYGLVDNRWVKTQLGKLLKKWHSKRTYHRLRKQSQRPKDDRSDATSCRSISYTILCNWLGTRMSSLWIHIRISTMSSNKAYQTFNIKVFNGCTIIKCIHTLAVYL